MFSTAKTENVGLLKEILAVPVPIVVADGFDKKNTHALPIATGIVSNLQSLYSWKLAVTLEVTGGSPVAGPSVETRLLENSNLIHGLQKW